MRRLAAWWRDLANAAGLLTLLRAPLALLAIAWAHDARVLLWLYLVGALSDIVDGPIARHTGRVSQTGAYADAVLDKLFNAIFTLILVFSGRVPALWIAAWFCRDFVQIGLILAFRRDAFAHEGFDRDANLAGKATTVLLGVTIVVVLLGLHDLAARLTVGVALLGLASAAGYGWREWRLRHPPVDPPVEPPVDNQSND